jgi:hypothetical protein
VALSVTTEAMAFGAVLGTFLVGEFTEQNNYIRRINVHWGVLVVRGVGVCLLV